MIIQALQKVFRKPIYAFLAFITGLAVLVFAVWLPNIPLIVRVMGHPGIPLTQKLDLPISLLGSIFTNFSPLAVSSMIAIAILFGINFAMMVYFLRRRVNEVKRSGMATGIFGITSGVVGIGCVACGSFILTSILSLFGASSILAFLPLAGGEFAILGAILLGASIYLIAKQIQNPVVCKINP